MRAKRGKFNLHKKHDDADEELGNGVESQMKAENADKVSILADQVKAITQISTGIGQ